MTLRDLLNAARREQSTVHQMHLQDGSRVTTTHSTGPATHELIALAPQLAEAIIKAEEVLEPFSKMAGEMFARNWNDDGVAVSIVTKDGPMRITFKEFREARAAQVEIEKLTGGGE